MTEVLRYAAFTDDPAGGNPAGIVLDAHGMSDIQMQQIAADVGYSETAFVVDANPTARRYRLRYFSPLAEVAFCGHATIATAVVLAEQAAPGRIIFNTEAGEIEVTTTAEPAGIRAALRSVPTSSRAASDNETAAVLSALRWPVADLAPEYPPHVAFAGNHHFVVGVRTRQRLSDLAYDYAELLAVMTARGWTTLQLFWAEDEQTIHARNPFPVGGVLEDPATGAAAAALGGYLRALGRVGQGRRITIRQGEDMGRPSELVLTIERSDDRSTVSGTAVPILTRGAGE